MSVKVGDFPSVEKYLQVFLHLTERYPLLLITHRNIFSYWLQFYALRSNIIVKADIIN